MKKLLIHTCCAPCFTYIQEELETQGLPLPDGSYEKVAYTACWYNPNIHPKVEYERRKQAFISFCDTHNTTYHVVDSYDMEAYAAMVATQVGQDKKYRIRCEYCYMLRLRKVFEIAKENGYDIVSTTLTISPYQNHEMIQKVGKQLEEEYGISFCYVDYRPHFREGQRMARELSIYMQKYCGCMFSMEMRYYNRNPIQARATNGYEIPKEPRMQVKKIENKEDYIDLLLEADPSKDMIHKYLNDSDVYALKKEDELISIAVILHIDRKTLELKNIVTKENYRNKGYAKTLLKSLCGNYKQKYDRMLVGTTENNIPFYVKQGFDKYEKTIKNFFIDNYKEEIKDGELTCTDLIYYSKDLKKK